MLDWGFFHTFPFRWWKSSVKRQKHLGPCQSAGVADVLRKGGGGERKSGERSLRPQPHHTVTVTRGRMRKNPRDRCRFRTETVSTYYRLSCLYIYIYTRIFTFRVTKHFGGCGGHITSLASRIYYGRGPISLGGQLHRKVHCQPFPLEQVVIL